jgi:hypothetical protein
MLYGSFSFCWPTGYPYSFYSLGMRRRIWHPGLFNEGQGELLFHKWRIAPMKEHRDPVFAELDALIAEERVYRTPHEHKRPAPVPIVQQPFRKMTRSERREVYLLETSR